MLVGCCCLAISFVPCVLLFLRLFPVFAAAHVQGTGSRELGRHLSFGHVRVVGVGHGHPARPRSEGESEKGCFFIHVVQRHYVVFFCHVLRLLHSETPLAIDPFFFSRILRLCVLLVFFIHLLRLHSVTPLTFDASFPGIFVDPSTAVPAFFRDRRLLGFIMRVIFTLQEYKG